MKSGNKALIAAVFLVIGGLFSGAWLAPGNKIFQESSAFSAPVLVQTAQAQDSLPVVAAVYSSALAGPVAAGNNGSENGISSLIYSDGAIEDAGSPAGASADTAFESSATQLAHQSEILPNFDKEFVMPTKGHSLGILHNYNAIDVTGACETPVVAAAAGLVVPDENNPDASDGWNGGYGNFILLEHSFGDSIFTRYAHLEKLLVNIGDYVSQGQEIGLIGKTGDATGCHLHFEVIGAANPFAKK